MPKYKVIAHRRVLKFLNDSTDQALKSTIKGHIEKLEGYPLSLRQMDTEKIRGAKNTFRLRVRKVRILFFVDSPQGTIFVTHIEARKRASEKTG